MTVIAYRDGVLAADKLSSAGGMRGTVTKIFRFGNSMVGVCGTMTLALDCVAWLKSGANPEDLPDCQKDADEFNSLLVVSNRKIFLYENGARPMQVEDEYCAIGCGATYAMSAMWCGKDAVEAVQCAIALNTGCGMGVDFLLAKDAPAKKRKKA